MDFEDILNEWDKLRSRGLRSDGQAKQTATGQPRLAPDELSASKKAQPPGIVAGKTPAVNNNTTVSAVRAAQQQWLDRYGVDDKDHQLAAFRQATIHRYLSRKEIDAIPIDAILDLHGMTALAAEEALDSFFIDAERRKLRKVLIIHGKGIHSRSGPVLADIVRRWLERYPAAGRSGSANNEDGGSGATWVLIKSR